MTRLLGALIAGAFAFVPMLSLAEGNDMKPPSAETKDAKAARDAAKAKWDAMTPEQQDAARKSALAKRFIQIGDFPTRYGDPGYRPPRTPEQREADARKAAADSEARLKKQAEQKNSEQP